MPADEFRYQYLRLVGHAAGEVVFDIATYPFEGVPEAWERQANAPTRRSS